MAGSFLLEIGGRALASGRKCAPSFGSMSGAPASSSSCAGGRACLHPDPFFGSIVKASPKGLSLSAPSGRSSAVMASLTGIVAVQVSLLLGRSSTVLGLDVLVILSKFRGIHVLFGA